jgi:phage terminase large subunit
MIMAQQIRISEIVGEGYRDFWNFKGRYLIVKGSRGSKKSTTAALKLIYNLERYPLSNAIVIRQIFNTLRDSCWKQLIWATEKLGVSAHWKFTVSPLEATNKITGQHIYFRGLDNPQSITSVTVAKGTLNWVWFEEFFQVTDEDAFNKIDLSLRGSLPQGYYRQIIGTFNPWSDHCWIKGRFFDTPNSEDKLALTTTYKINEWLDESDLKIFAEMKEKYPRRYEIEGLGNWGISEGLIFDNWEVKDFNPNDLDLPLAIGLDWGWEDPTAISIMRVDDKEKIIYLCKEYYHNHKTLDQVTSWLVSNGYQKSQIIADSAEPRSIEELKRKGIAHIKPAAKGKGSIMEGIRKLQEYHIIIHPSCSNANAEFSNYCFEKDKATGQYTDKPIDDWCHIIDSMRYGIQIISSKQKLQTMNKGSLGL